jgi:ABC-type sugar transport system ATPase subunit
VTTRNELIKQQHEIGTTSIYVTHDQVEAMTGATASAS